MSHQYPQTRTPRSLANPAKRAPSPSKDADDLARARVSDRMASIGTLAAGLGHDMHNVLLPIRAHLHAAEAAKGPRALHTVRRSIARVQKSIDYLQHLADGLHFLTLDPEIPDGGRTDLPKWWRQAGDLLSKALPKHVRLRHDFPTSGPRALPPVAIAPHRLTQAVLNLIVNAGQAIPLPGNANRTQGLVEVWAERVRTRSTPPREMVRLSVRDNGVGMTPEVLRRAFEMFFTTKPRGLGTGLGLPLVARVVENAGGSVHLTSAPGRGTTASLDLPILRSRSADSLLATLTLDHARAASVLRQMLTAAGVRTRDAALPSSSAIWIIDPAPSRLAHATRWLAKDASRRLILIGPLPPSHHARWLALHPLLVEDPNDLPALRLAVQHVISHA